MDEMNRPMRTITFQLPEEFAEVLGKIDYAVMTMMSYCGKCGGDINGQATKHGQWGVEADHWRCQGCDLSYCDECVRTVMVNGDVPDGGFLCLYCAEKEPAYQHCDVEDCDHYHWDDDEDAWNCHYTAKDREVVMCPKHFAEWDTMENRSKCAGFGYCEECEDHMNDPAVCAECKEAIGGDVVITGTPNNLTFKCEACA